MKRLALFRRGGLWSVSAWSENGAFGEVSLDVPQIENYVEEPALLTPDDKRNRYNMALEPVRKRLFAPIRNAKSSRFAKTGSGQIKEKLTKQEAFPAGYQLAAWVSSDVVSLLRRPRSVCRAPVARGARGHACMDQVLKTHASFAILC